MVEIEGLAGPHQGSGKRRGEVLDGMSGAHPRSHSRLGFGETHFAALLVDDLVSEAIELCPPIGFDRAAEEPFRRAQHSGGPVELLEAALKEVQVAAEGEACVDVGGRLTLRGQGISQHGGDEALERGLGVEDGQSPLPSLQASYGREEELMEDLELVRLNGQVAKELQSFWREGIACNEVVVAIESDVMGAVDAEGRPEFQLAKMREQSRLEGGRPRQAAAQPWRRGCSTCPGRL